MGVTDYSCGVYILVDRYLMTAIAYLQYANLNVNLISHLLLTGLSNEFRNLNKVQNYISYFQYTCLKAKFSRAHLHNVKLVCPRLNSGDS